MSPASHKSKLYQATRTFQGELVAWLIAKHGTGKKAAAVLGVSRNTVSRLLNHHRRQTLVKFAKAGGAR